MKRHLGWLIALAVAGSFCGRREAPAPSAATLSRHLTGDPATLDPTISNEENALLVEALLFRPLLGIDGDRKPVPGLAKSWSASPDGLVYEFHLDPAATWDDGSPVTSDDVRFTIERIRDPKVPAYNWRSGYEDLVAIETPDAATVRVRFRVPYSERLLTLNLPIVSAAAFGRAKGPADTDRKPVGDGPYRFASWDANQKIRLVKRTDAAGAGAAFSEVVFRVISNGATRFQAGSRGDLDEFRISRDERKAGEANPEFASRFRIVKVPQFMEALIIWNCKAPFLSDARVRRALVLAWPREESARRLYPPEGASLVSGPYPSGVAESAPDVAPPREDLAEAARLLDQAGWKASAPGTPRSPRRKDGKAASVELLFPAGQAIYTQLAEILHSAYAKLGVELVERPLDWAAFTQRGDAGEFEAQLTGRLFLPPNVDPYPYYHSSQCPPNGANAGCYRNPEVDRAMEAARREMDPEKRLEAYRQVHRLMVADPPADFLWGGEQYWAISKRIDGVQVSAIGLFHFLPGPLGWHPAGSASASGATAP
jgi:peptide/nickel transport system substrate-binding protein